MPQLSRLSQRMDCSKFCSSIYLGKNTEGRQRIFWVWWFTIQTFWRNVLIVILSLECLVQELRLPLPSSTDIYTSNELQRCSVAHMLNSLDHRIGKMSHRWSSNVFFEIYFSLKHLHSFRPSKRILQKISYLKV